MENPSLVSLAEQLLLAVKTGKPTRSLAAALANTKKDHLNTLVNDAEKKAFWINCYNAYYQVLKTERGLENPGVYRLPAIEIAHQNLSLDTIEHGILRGGRYRREPKQFHANFDADFIASLAIDVLDARIHFALNCGAKSCPPIAFYRPAGIDQQLNVATQSFLEGETSFDAEQRVVYTSAILDWFQEDFGGQPGIVGLYLKQLDRNIEGWEIRYKAYSWEEDLGNFVPDKKL